MGAVHPLAQAAVSGGFPRNWAYERRWNRWNDGRSRNWPDSCLFCFMGLYQVSTMPCGALGPVGADDGGHKPLNSAALHSTHGCCGSACPAIRPVTNLERGKCGTPAIPASCSDRDEAGGGNLPGSLDVLHGTSKRAFSFHGSPTLGRGYCFLLRSCRTTLGRRGALLRENIKRARKGQSHIHRFLGLSAPQYCRLLFFFSVQGKGMSTPAGCLSRFQGQFEEAKGYTTPLSRTDPP